MSERPSLLRSRYDEYIRRFNEEDVTAFDEFFQPDIRMQNGMYEVRGVDAMKDNYGKVWSTFKDTLHVERFVGDDALLAVQLYTTFLALKDSDESPFGPVRTGDEIEFRGIVMYEVKADRFANINVAYNRFTLRTLAGPIRELGIPQ